MDYKHNYSDVEADLILANAELLKYKDRERQIRNMQKEHKDGNFYIVSEAILLDLLYDSHKLAALENGGVDNWGGYSWSLEDYSREDGKSLEETAKEELLHFCKLFD